MRRCIATSPTLSVIDALKNGIMLMTAVIPPGLLFDAVDIPDMLVSFLLSQEIWLSHLERQKVHMV